MNIACIDFFYHFEAGELVHVIILLAGVLYLLLQDYNRLKEFFFYAKSNLVGLPFKNRLLRVFIRLSVVLIPASLILSYSSPDKNPQLTGKYTVTNLLINQKPVAATSCGDSVLTIVYFDTENDIVFEFNSLQRRLIGSYQFSKNNDHFDIARRYPANQSAFNGTLMTDKQNQITLIGKMGSDSLRVLLSKKE